MAISVTQFHVSKRMAFVLVLWLKEYIHHKLIQSHYIHSTVVTSLIVTGPVRYMSKIFTAVKHDVQLNFVLTILCFAHKIDYAH